LRKTVFVWFVLANQGLVLSSERSRSAMQGDKGQLIRRGLLALRLALGVSILFWGIVALEGPARGKVLFAALPGLVPSPQIAVLGAVGEIALGVFIAMGLLRSLSYGLGFFLQAVAVFASHAVLLHPLDGANAVYAGMIPVLVAHGALFVLRSEDRLLAVDSMLTAGRKPETPLQIQHLAEKALHHVTD
jgi:putative oxidoreductase